MDYTVQKEFVKDDKFSEPEYFRRYKKQIFDTAFGCLINEFIIFASDTFDCLKWYSTEYIEYITSTIDPTSIFQDWDGISALKVPEEDWINHLTLSVRRDDYEEETELMKKVHERITEDYEIIDYQIDMRAISEYINSPRTPLITQTEDKPDCCIDDVVRIPYDDYHKWLEENSDIPNLVIDEDGQIRPSDGEKKNGQKVVPGKQHCGMTYAEYFNINFWNHCCWYKNPFTPVCGYGPLNCCEAEQLVYPGATPSHQHDGPKGCGCGCGKHKHPSSHDGVYPDDEDYCYDWNII
jgi:hypothetical protein